MAYTQPVTVVTGQVWTAANQNTYIKANFEAGVPDIFTAAGDLAIASAANAASPLAIGSAGQVLGVVSALPAWVNSLLITAAPASDHVAEGLKITLKAHENLAFGDVCYINVDGEAQIVDADAIATASGIAMCADASISANANGTFLLFGIARDDTWAWTPGGWIYITVTGTSGNSLSQTPVSATDDVVQIVGIATHADRMFFNPQLVQIEHV